MGRLNILSFISIVLLNPSCCTWDYESSDFKFNSEELKHVKSFDCKNTISFTNSENNTDTVFVNAMDTISYVGSRCPISTPPVNTIAVNAQKRQLIFTEGKAGTRLINIPLLTIEKRPLEKLTKYHFHFPTFYNGSWGFSTNPELIVLNRTKINDCYRIPNEYQKSGTDTLYITSIYWTDSIGLVGYQEADGDTWVRSTLIKSVVNGKED